MIVCMFVCVCCVDVCVCVLFVCGMVVCVGGGGDVMGLNVIVCVIEMVSDV